MDTDCGEYVIKAMNNGSGPPVLIAERVGSMAARWIGVDIPDFAVVELSDAVVEFLKRRAVHTAEKFDGMIHEDDGLWGADDQD